MRLLFVAFLTLTFGLALMPAHAEEVVSAGGVKALLVKPKGAPRASLILLAGGDGVLAINDQGPTRLKGNSLVRTREAFAARGFAVLVPDFGFNLAALVEYMTAIKRPVIVVGTSRGTQRAVHGIAGGAKPDGLVLTSGFLSDESGDYDNAVNTLGSPDKLPPTLIVHHRLDACQVTSPDGVAPFMTWAGKKARVAWLNGGTPDGDPCGGSHYHGFNGIEGQMVSTIAAFAGSVR